jgi:DHA2 family methylenomycin A resistance protein-like MFS transporter
MAMFDVTVVNVALGSIQREFGAPLSELVWVIDAYTLTFAALLLFGGALADRLGAKRTYMIGLVWFVVASMFCAAASSGPILVAARLLQGIGAAFFMPSSLSLLTESFPDRVTRTKLLGIWGAIVGAAAGAGPFVGGLLVYNFGWRSIFYLNVPIGILGVILTSLFLRPSLRKNGGFDLASHAFIILSLAGLSFVLIEGPTFGWLSHWIVTVAAITAMGFCLIVIRERGAAHPVIPRSLAGNAPFWALNGMGFLVNFVMFGEVFLMSLYLQKAHGASALVTGVDLLPVMCMFSLFNVGSGFLSNRWGGRRVMLVGLSCAVTGTSFVVLLGGGVSYWLLVFPIALCNAGMGLAIPAMVTGVMHEAGRNHANVGAATLNANRQIGALAGVAVMGIALHLIHDWSISLRAGFGAFAICLALALGLIWWRYGIGCVAMNDLTTS